MKHVFSRIAFSGMLTSRMRKSPYIGDKHTATGVMPEEPGVEWSTLLRRSNENERFLKNSPTYQK